MKLASSYGVQQYLKRLFYFSGDFRLFCGDLGTDVTDELLTRIFSKYPSFLKAKVVRDKRTNKTKGFGFLSFKDPTDFIQAIKEMNGEFDFNIFRLIVINTSKTFAI